MSGSSGVRGGIAHLARRFAGSLSRRPPAAADVVWAHSHLSAAEAALWDAMAVADRRHSIEVARRFVGLRPAAIRAEMAGALLHDVGKTEAGLGTIGRVLATIVGPRTARFRTYHHHEALGAALLTAAASDPITVALVGGTAPADVTAILHAADEV